MHIRQSVPYMYKLSRSPSVLPYEDGQSFPHSLYEGEDEEDKGALESIDQSTITHICVIQLTFVVVAAAAAFACFAFVGNPKLDRIWDRLHYRRSLSSYSGASEAVNRRRFTIKKKRIRIYWCGNEGNFVYGAPLTHSAQKNDNNLILSPSIPVRTDFLAIFVKEREE